MSGRDIFVPGVPVAQGSKRHVGRGVMVEANKRLRPWRATVTAAILDAGWADRPILSGPVGVNAVFTLPRPGHHYGTGRNSGVLKANAPIWHDKARGDLDKLSRSILDSITDAGAIRDDAQVAWLSASKQYGQPGVRITLEPLT
jgi:crossover junction endodeoxyribonuclease RusA